MSDASGLPSQASPVYHLGHARSVVRDQSRAQLTSATIDGRSLVAIGCEEGVWIGLHHDPRSLRKVLHVKQVTNIAVLEDFGIFLVLQDKASLSLSRIVNKEAQS